MPFSPRCPLGAVLLWECAVVGPRQGDTAVGFNVHKAVKGHKHFLVSDLMGILMGVHITLA